MTAIGAGVIGLGVGEQHALGYEQQPDCCVVSLCDIEPDTLSDVGSRFPHAATTVDWHQTVEHPDVHVISIASFDNSHVEQTVTAIEHGKHVLVEKPLAKTTGDLTRIKQALADHTNVKLASNLVLRAAPVYRWLREAIEAGELGEVYAFDGDYLYGRIHKITEGWRGEEDDYSVMQGGGIHLADLMLWLTGQRPTMVSSHGNGICTRGTAFRYCDFVSSTFTFPSSLVGRITANFGCVHQHQHVVRVFGTKATFVLDDQGPRLFTTRDRDRQPPRRLELSTRESAKWDLIPDFVRTIRASGDGRPLAQREFDTVSICIAADQSLAAQHPREIEYV